ncbi:MAG: hypothetical protein F6K24_30995, partial [Okeania sp. SIO2D1]|nr:hypothetical protein [Okeania sp. SIO2D1]
MSTSSLGLKKSLCPPKNLGQKRMLKVRSPLIQASQLMLPQTSEKSDNFFTFAQNFSRSDYPEKPTSITSQFIEDNFESESDSENQINQNIAEVKEELHTYPSAEKNIQNNPLLELHPRFGKQIIQTQSRILTTAADKMLFPQNPQFSDDKFKKNQSDNLSIVQAKWEGDIYKPVSEQTSVSQVDTSSDKNQAISYSVIPQIAENQEITANSPVEDNNINISSYSEVQLRPSYSNIVFQQLIPELPIDSVQEKSTVKSPEIKPKSSDETIEIQQLIPELPINLVEEKSTVKLPDIAPKVSDKTVENQELIPELPINLVQEKSVQSSEITPTPSDETIESKQLIPEIPVDLVQENSTVQLPETAPGASDETIKPQELIQEKSTNLVPKTSTIPASEKNLEETNIASEETLESQQLIPEELIDSVQEESIVKLPEITPQTSDENIKPQQLIPESPDDLVEEKS